LLLLLFVIVIYYYYYVLISERMGWVPAGNEIPEPIKSSYKWIEGLSVTEMEIMHGAYRKDNPNGALYPLLQCFNCLT